MQRIYIGETAATGSRIFYGLLGRNEHKRFRAKVPRRGLFLGRTATKVIVALAAGVLPIAGRCGSDTSLIARLLGLHMNDVAVQVAELPETYRDLIVPGVDFGPDGNHVAVVSDHDRINIWDWRRARIDKTLEQPKGFNAPATGNPIQFSPDGRLFAVCAGKGVGDVFVRLWDTNTWSIAKDLKDSGSGGCDGMGFTPNGRLFIRIVDRFTGPGDVMVVYTVETWQPLWGLSMQKFGPQSVAISPDGALVAIGGTLTVVPPGILEIPDIAQRLQQLKHEANVYVVSLEQRKVIRVIKGEEAGRIAWNPDGVQLAIVGGPHVEIFDVRSGKSLLREKIEKSGTMNARYTRDGRYLIESDLNGMGKGLGVKIWDSQRQKLLQEIPGDIGSIAVSHDDKYLAVGTTGRTTVWQLK